MRLLMTSPDAHPAEARLVLSVATSPEEVQEVQRLRYKVFIEALGLSDLVNRDGLDRDEFDKFCTHLPVRDRKTLKVVGTYRVLGADAARQSGRACIHPHYRRRAIVSPRYGH